MSVAFITLPYGHKGYCKHGEDGQESCRWPGIGLARNMVATEDESVGNHVKNEEGADGNEIQEDREVGKQCYSSSACTWHDKQVHKLQHETEVGITIRNGRYFYNDPEAVAKRIIN